MAQAKSFSVSPDVPIRDLKTSTLSMTLADSAPVLGVRVSVDIEHTWIGDLVVSLRPPTALGLGDIILHNGTGGGTDNIKTTYDAVNAPGLAGLAGKSPKGTWALKVKDTAVQDTGKIRSFSLELSV